MAASTADAFGGAPQRARLRGSLRRLVGVLLVALAVGLAVALWGFDWRDPSLEPGDRRSWCTIRPARSAPMPPTCSTSCSASQRGCPSWWR